MKAALRSFGRLEMYAEKRGVGHRNIGYHGSSFRVTLQRIWPAAMTGANDACHHEDGWARA